MLVREGRCSRCGAEYRHCGCWSATGGPALPEEAVRELERLWGRDPRWSRPEMVEIDLGPVDRDEDDER